MLKFEHVEELAAYMFEKIDGDDPVSVVVDKDLAVDVMKELLDYNNVILNFANVDIYDYDKEYIVSLYDDTDTDYWHVSIEQLYNYEKEMYFGTDGYILFHEDVNSKALVDMLNNENVELSGYDWFVISEDDEGTNDTDETETESDNNILTVNGKCVSVDEYNAFVSKFAPDMRIQTNKESSAISTYKVNGKEVSKETYEKTLSNIEDKYLDRMRDMLLRHVAFIDECNEWRKILGW